ncbi:MAG: hypothetical protein C4318_01650 [Acidimicrobiia bacterium]
MSSRPARKIYLAEFCTARSGDKDDVVNIAIFAKSRAAYELIKERVSAEAAARHLSGLVRGTVERYEVPNVFGLNFVCTRALDGGASVSRRSDNLGKAFGSHLLALQIEIPEDITEELLLG